MNISQEDHKILKEFLWWTADKKTPYIIKGGIKNECYYIVVTDLKNAWYRKADRETILEEKDKFNRAIQVSNFDGILDLLNKPLSTYDKQADYQFELLNSERSLVMELQTQINVYPFKWQFFLSRVNESVYTELLVEDLINPLLCSLKASEMRANLLKKQFADLENEYKRKLNEKERQNYKSKFDDSEESWKFLIKDMPIDNKVADFDLSEASNYFFKEYSSMRIKKVEEEERKERERRTKNSVGKRKADQVSPVRQADDIANQFADDYTESVEEIMKKRAIETEVKKKEEKKKVKKIDKFL